MATNIVPQKCLLRRGSRTLLYLVVIIYYVCTVPMCLSGQFKGHVHAQCGMPDKINSEVWLPDE